MATLDIVLTANSPGEVSAWLTPAVRALRRQAPEAVISVFIPPCTFASGAECSVAAAVPEIDHVYGPLQFWGLALTGKRPAGFRPRRRGVVCFLGGDLMYAAWLARRLHYPALAYNEGRARWLNVYQRFLVPDQAAQKRACNAGADPGKVHVIGDLMLDAVRPTTESAEAAREMLGIPGGSYVVSLFPGSRPFELQYMLPFLMRVAEVVRHAADRPAHFLLSLAPFADEDALRNAAATVLPDLEGVAARVSASPPLTAGKTTGVWLLDTGKVQVTAVRGLQYDIMQASDIAITVPGSNTAEMAAMGLPMVVALPLNKPEVIPLEGLPGLIGRLPLAGRALKRAAVLKAAEKHRFAALPNRRAGKMLVPEVRGKITPEDVAIAAVDLLQRKDRRKTISASLRAVMGEPGAADRLAAHVLAVAGAAAEPEVGEA